MDFGEIEIYYIWDWWVKIPQLSGNPTWKGVVEIDHPTETWGEADKWTG